MGKEIRLTAADGHEFSAYEKTPSSGVVRGGLVVVQEIFGVNAHIRRVADDYAGEGYRVIAPAIFDRAERGVELGYEAEDRERAFGLARAVGRGQMLADIAAAVAALGGSGPVGIVGYCLGGTMAWLSAARIPGLAAAIGYYGGGIAKLTEEAPQCPVMLHFGVEDPSIPIADVETIQGSVDPALVQVFVYENAGHAFNRDGTTVFRADAARVARDRSIAFLRKHIG